MQKIEEISDNNEPQSQEEMQKMLDGMIAIGIKEEVITNGSQLEIDPQAKFTKQEELEDDVLRMTPLIPDTVYANLPDFIKKIVNTVQAADETDETKRERDMLFIGTIIMLSSCLPEIYGNYGPEKLYPHLYAFIVAPPASGKGVLKIVKSLLESTEDKVEHQFRAEYKAYKEKEDAFKVQIEKGEIEEIPKLITPPLKKFLLPSDSSHAALINDLHLNGGNGIMIENEADSMGNTNGQIWGKYGSLLRLAFHHETISKTRVTSSTVIRKPKLAVLLSGTPGQVQKVIPSAENGLFSRFILYLFRNKPKWKNPFTLNYNEETVDTLSDELIEILKHLNDSPTEVKLTKEQIEKIDAKFPSLLAEAVVFTGEDTSSTVFRLGTILFRICMVFTGIRKYESKDSSKECFCNDIDFDCSLKLVEIFLEHSNLMFESLPKDKSINIKESSSKKKKLLAALPEHFTRPSAVIKAKDLNILEGTVGGLLKAAVEQNLLRRLDHGIYQKIK